MSHSYLFLYGIHGEEQKHPKHIGWIRVEGFDRLPTGNWRFRVSTGRSLAYLALAQARGLRLPVGTYCHYAPVFNSEVRTMRFRVEFKDVIVTAFSQTPRAGAISTTVTIDAAKVAHVLGFPPRAGVGAGAFSRGSARAGCER